MAGLGVNIDHVATVRQARRTVEPEPLLAAAEAELGGADCITFHLRQDRRHIIDRDVHLLKQTVQVKLNMEMSLAEEIVEIALEIRPQQASLVPENRQEVTTEGGLDVRGQMERVAKVVRRLKEAGVIVSAFIDPDPAQIAASRDAGFDAIEIHTGRYANAAGDEVAETLDEIRAGLDAGLKAGLIVHGGHGLTYRNITPVAAMEGFSEFNIGHSIISRAIFTGLREAVREMKRLIDRAEGH
ncbi:MAG: pyridoxine 5'-phosphate synthase [Planctomycetota bacterium]|nr:pyridoxine 5'-phosphate synthase [Planctomycetota bacterium]